MKCLSLKRISLLAFVPALMAVLVANGEDELEKLKVAAYTVSVSLTLNKDLKDDAKKTLADKFETLDKTLEEAFRCLIKPAL